jgi:hypothetical protein
MRIPMVIVASLMAVFLLCPGAGAATFTENFSGTLSPELKVHEDPGFSFTISGGRGIFTQAAGTGNGFANLYTSFEILGDFTITVWADRTSIYTGETGLAVYYPNNLGFADAFFFNNWAASVFDVRGNIDVTPGFPSGTVANGTPVATFKLERTGNTLREYFDAGSGFVKVNEASHDNLALPVRAGLFLTQEMGSTVGQRVLFDNFSITADNFKYSTGAVSSVLILLLAD